MLPSLYVELEALPRLPSGKVDRRALPASEEGAPTPRRRAPLEELLAGTFARSCAWSGWASTTTFSPWAASVMATQTVSRLARGAGVNLPVRALFEAPTVAISPREWRCAVSRRLAQPTIVPFRARATCPFPSPRAALVLDYWAQQPLHNLPSAVRLSGRLDVAA